MYSSFGALIHNYRKENKMSMAEFAKKAGISKAYVGLLERGENYRNGKPIAPSIKKLRLIADAMEISVGEMLRLVSDGTISPEGKDEVEVSEVFRKLKQENRAKLLEIGRLYLKAQISEESQ